MNYDKLIKIVDGAGSDTLEDILSCFSHCGHSVSDMLESSRKLLSLVQSMPTASKSDYDTYYIGVKEGMMCMFHSDKKREFEVMGKQYSNPSSSGSGRGAYKSHYYDHPVAKPIRNFRTLTEAFRDGKIVVLPHGEAIWRKVIEILNDIPEGL